MAPLPLFPMTSQQAQYPLNIILRLAFLPDYRKKARSKANKLCFGESDT